jgi:hypothetical protein
MDPAAGTRPSRKGLTVESRMRVWLPGQVLKHLNYKTTIYIRMTGYRL